MVESAGRTPPGILHPNSTDRWSSSCPSLCSTTTVIDHAFKADERSRDCMFRQNDNLMGIQNLRSNTKEVSVERPLTAKRRYDRGEKRRKVSPSQHGRDFLLLLWRGTSWNIYLHALVRRRKLNVIIIYSSVPNVIFVPSFHEIFTIWKYLWIIKIIW